MPNSKKQDSDNYRFPAPSLFEMLGGPYAGSVPAGLPDREPRAPPGGLVERPEAHGGRGYLPQGDRINPEAWQALVDMMPVSKNVDDRRNMGVTPLGNRYFQLR